MTPQLDPTLRGLNDCGCCAGVTIYTPATINNRPGLASLARRVGSHGQFRASMLARMSKRVEPGEADRAALSGAPVQPVRSTLEPGLTTRAVDDFSIALIDAWAAVADVLAFYNERYANEAYLRTATERLSVLELARLIGYQLRPGVAAESPLAFMLDENVESITIEKGTRVQSLPKGEELPQTFETMADIPARAEWNALKPRQRQPQVLNKDVTCILLKGLSVNVKAGDKLLIAPAKELKTAVCVQADPKTQTTRVDLVSASAPVFDLFTIQAAVFTRSPLALNTHNIQTQVLSKTWNASDLTAFAAAQKWPLAALQASLNAQIKQALVAPGQNKYAMMNFAQATALAENIEALAGQALFVYRQRAAPFGYNAPVYNALPVPDKKTVGDIYGSNWDSPARNLAAEPYVYLDSLYPGIVEDSWVTLCSGSDQLTCQVEESAESTHSSCTLSAKVTRLKLKGFPDLSAYGMRDTLILAQSEELALADIPFQETIGGNNLVLDRYYSGLQTGQVVILSGECRDPAGVQMSEVLTLHEITNEAGFTRLTFKKALAYSYIGETVTINANVAQATHGESKGQVLGSGDGTQPYQRFTLNQKDLSYVSASTTTGRESTLEIRVDGVSWHERPDLAAAGPTDRDYITRMDDDHKTQVIFGDGQHGARLPSGLENVWASYRSGIGQAGNVEAGRLTLLARRPQGVRGVMNPLAASGGDDPEKLDSARANAPLGVLTLDRVVSLQDYQDYARAFAGIAKALATWTWFNQKQGVFLTVAGPGGSVIDPSGTIASNLRESIYKVGEPFVPLRIETYREAYFVLAANIRIDPDMLKGKVLGDVEHALRSAFSFEAREFGQGVTFSEVMGVIQNVTGVLAVDLRLWRTDGQPHLRAAVPEPTRAGPVLAAELLTLDPRPLELGVMP